MKKCSSCSIEKPLDQFTRRAASRDGLNASCRGCAQERDQKRYRKEASYRSYKHKEYMRTEQGKQAHASAVEKWKSLNTVKRAAQVLIGNRVKSGKIVKQPCQMCGTELGVHAHHDDYYQPLNVMWLCVVHHKARHAYLEYISRQDQEAA